MVRDAAQAKRLLAVGGLLAAAALGGCGGSGSDAGKAKGGAPATTPALPASATSGKPNLGEIRLVDCRDWRRGDDTARYGTIAQLASFAAGPSGGGVSGHDIPARRAYGVLAGWCKQSYATYFKLYKLYDRAAAFTPADQQ